MTRRAPPLLARLLLCCTTALTLGACSQITDFGRFGERDGAADADMDGATDAGDAGMDAGDAGMDGATDGAMDSGSDGAMDGGDGAMDGGDACTADTSSDPNNCGECGNICPTPTNGSAACVGGECDIDCDPGFANCDGDATSCETELGTLTDCTSCGNACIYEHASAVCETDGCALEDCVSGWGDCNSDPDDGCEQDLSSPDHCGMCDNPCGSDEVCSGDACAESCGDTETDCDGACVDTMTSISHCGGCDMPCERDHATAECEGGTCAIDTCDSGYGNCDEDDSNGCEEELQTWFVDDDEDGYGEPGTGSELCTAEAEADGRVSNADDCDDTDPDVNPDAEEVCNGTDDDCDGHVDEGFDCCPGDTRACRTSCGSEGTEECAGDGTWSDSCDPPAETCNRMDDDCDDRTDESLLSTGPAVTLSDSEDAAENVRAAASPGGELAASWTRTDGSGAFVVACVDASGSPVDTVTVASGNDTYDGDVAWDGTSWVAVYAETPAVGSPRVMWALVDPGDCSVSEGPMLLHEDATVAPQAARASRVPGTSMVAVAWNSEGVTAGAIGSAVVEGTTQPGAPGAVESEGDRDMGIPAVVGLPGDRYGIAWRFVQRGGSPGASDPAEIHYARLEIDGSVTDTNTFAADVNGVESFLDASLDADSREIALAYRKDDGATTETVWVALDPDGTPVGSERSLADAEGARAAYAGDGSTGLAQFFSSSDPLLQRFLTGSGTRVPGDVSLPASRSADVAGFVSGSPRYGYVHWTDGEVRLVRVMCTP
ncbi:MAG: hypothetical protein ACOCUS_00450 [Polyangiales bacterium]